MNSLLNNNLTNPNPQLIMQIKQMYNVYSNNPKRFLREYIKANPQHAQTLQFIQNPQQAFQSMLNQYGLNQEQFNNIFK